MMNRTSKVAVVIIASLGLAGCTVPSDSDTESSPAEGSIELAVTETCGESSDAQCIGIGQESVIRPAEFDVAPVAEVEVSDDSQQNAVDITLTEEGSRVVTDLTGEASEQGDDTRLVMKVGGEIIAAVRVEETLVGEDLTISLAPDQDPQDIVELIRGS